MKIKKKRISTLTNYLIGLNETDEFYIAFTDLSNIERLKKVGFSDQLNIGEQVLPNILGKSSTFNAEGSFVKHKDRPKETKFRDSYVKDWHGNYHIVDIPYKVYQRTPIPAPEVQLTVVEGANNERIVSSPKLIRGDTSDNLIIHIINLFLELFYECEILQENLAPIFNVPVKKLNWDVLPQGNYPWSILKDQVHVAIGNVGPNKRRLIEHRLEVISNHNPEFVAVGHAGFSGYIVFGFSEKDFFVLESIREGNATYILGKDWEKLSRLSKFEILKEDLHKDRIVHRKGWEESINTLF